MPEPDLATLQRWMQALILHSVDTEVAAAEPEARALIPRDAALSGAIVKPSAQQSPLERLQVYNGGYVARLVEVLETDYKATKWVLGDEPWRRLAMACVYANPSRYPNLNPYGAPLAAFLAGRDDVPHREFVVDLARLEWAVTEAFDAPEFEPYDMARLQGVPEERWVDAVLVANPSLRVLEFAHPANRFFQRFLADEAPAVPAPAPSHVAVYRKQRTVFRLELPAPIAAILRALCAGEPFGAALAAGGAHDHDVGAWFREWSADGLFVDVRLGA